MSICLLSEKVKIDFGEIGLGGVDSFTWLRIGTGGRLL
jgi:hypothetical protein